MDNGKRAARHDLPAALQEHQALGLLLALHHEGRAGPLLIECGFNLSEQVQMSFAPRIICYSDDSVQ